MTLSSSVPVRLAILPRHFNAMPLIQALDHGATGVVRAGCMMHTTIEEVDRLLNAVADTVLQRTTTKPR